MTSVFALILLILGFGFFARKYNGWIRLLLIVTVGVIVLYVSLKA